MSFENLKNVTIVASGGTSSRHEPTQEHFARGLDILEDAFAVDPLTTFLAHTDKAREFLRPLFEVYLEGEPLVLYLTEDGRGAAFVSLPQEPSGEGAGEERDPPTEAGGEVEGGQPAVSPAMVELQPMLKPERMADFDKFSQLSHTQKDAFRAQHGPIHVLGFVAVTQGSQGLGVGSLLLRSVVDDAHRLGYPVYLDSTSAASARLYERHGFIQHDVIELGEGEEIAICQVMATRPPPPPVPAANEA